MTIATTSRIKLNGTIDPSQNVMSNIIQLANNSQCWVTWDTALAKWRIIPNAPTTVRTDLVFNDTTIIGSVNVTGTGLTQMYNAADVSFKSNDLRGDSDTINIKLPTSSRYVNEMDNKLSITYSMTNEPVQAQLLGSIEVLQGRLDKIISFTTDYSSIGLSAGDVIQITNSVYGYSNKQFRVVTVEESDTDDGGIAFTITAIEYDSSIYNSTLTRDQRDKTTNIIPFELNQCVQDKIAENTAEEILKTGACLLLARLNSGEISMANDELPSSMSDDDFFFDEIYDTVLGGYNVTDIFDAASSQYRYNLGLSFTATRSGIHYIEYQIGRRTTLVTYLNGAIVAPPNFRIRNQLCIQAGSFYVTTPLTGSVGRRELVPAGGTSGRDWFKINLQEGQTINFHMYYMTDFGDSNPGWGPGSAFGFVVDIMVNYCGSDNGY